MDHHHQETEIPEFFICPISLQIMKDPVTAQTGITYDRESIENWLFKRHNTICPVTKLPLLLPSDDQLTPNHTLRRLIQSWSAINNHSSPPPPISYKFSDYNNNSNYIANLIRDLWLPNSQMKALKELETAQLTINNEKTRKKVAESGVAKPILSIVVSCYRKREITPGLQEALSILYLLRNSFLQTSKLISIENDEILDALVWVLSSDHDHSDSDSLLILKMKNNAAFALKLIVQKANSGTLERLKPEFFSKLPCFLRKGKGRTRESEKISAINALLHVFLDCSPWGRNRVMMVEAGAIFALIELELEINNNSDNNSSEKKRTTELILGVLFHLCSCADGRAQFLNHAAGIALVARRILKVSPAADDRAILIISLICKFSPTVGVLQEMLKVGAVAKLCMVIQANCASYLKDRAREILRNHNNVWKNSPCVEIAALTSNKVC